MGWNVSRKPKKVAVAEKTNQFAILTNDGFYILDIEKREILFYDEQTYYKYLAEIPTKNKFIVATFDKIGIVNKKFETKFLNIKYGIDCIKFGEYSGRKLNVSFEKLPYYGIFSGFLNTENLKIESE